MVVGAGRADHARRRRPPSSRIPEETGPRLTGSPPPPATPPDTGGVRADATAREIGPAPTAGRGNGTGKMDPIPGVLVVDDDLTVRRTLGMNLHARGYAPLYAATGEQALALAAKRLPDAVLLDLGLPSLDGLSVLRSLRGWSDGPILVVSGDADPGTKVEALDAGADDYVTKPFSMGELFARLRSVMRRREASARLPPPVVTADFTIDFRAERVTRQGRHVPLTPRQWHIVEVLACEPGTLVGHGRLLREVWGPGYGTEHHYLRVFMSHIRRRLEPDPRRPRYFVTETGAGFRFLPGDPPGQDPAVSPVGHRPPGT